MLRASVLQQQLQNEEMDEIIIIMQINFFSFQFSKMKSFCRLLRFLGHFFRFFFFFDGGENC